jgi:hypothetical protein
MVDSNATHDSRKTRIGWLLAVPPLCAIIAGSVSTWLAVSRPDPPIDQNVQLTAISKSAWPAKAARNHAATPEDQRRAGQTSGSRQKL